MNRAECHAVATGGCARAWAVLLLCLVTMTQAAAASEPRGGLRLYGGDARLLGYAPQLETDVAIDVSGMLARVRVTQRFSNPGNDWVEGIYVFPLPEDAAVERLRMRYAGRVIEGEIQEKAQARRTYEQARARGQGAGLVDQQRANIFTTSVANIPPGESVQVEIEYQHVVRWQGRGYSLRFPMVVAPRYIPGTASAARHERARGHGWARDTEQVPDASQITPPVIAEAATEVNPLRLVVRLNSGLPLLDIASAYHPVRVQVNEDGSHRVELAAGTVPAERDFELRWQPHLGSEPVAALFSEAWQDSRYGLLMIMPPLEWADERRVARELILVVDTSGSMHGESIAQARAALDGALDHLRDGDRFNVIRFDNAFDALFGRAQPVNAQRLRQARGYVRALEAEGGTEMLPALRFALRDPDPSGLLRQVVFITDGAVGNEEALFGALAAELGDSRLFTVGIGSAPNALFMTRAATLGRGTFTFIGELQEVGAKVSTLFRQLSAPVLTDVTLQWDGDDAAAGVVQAPARVPDLYAGEPLSVAVRSPQVLRRVTVRGRLGGRPWHTTLALDGGASADGVHALWARRLIDDWLERKVIGEDPQRVRDAVLALALHHQLVSPYTSLVAVDRTPSRPAADALRAAAVPARLPAGWSADAVFGHLPRTATAAPLWLLGGLASFVLAAFARWRRV